MSLGGSFSQSINDAVQELVSVRTARVCTFS